MTESGETQTLLSHEAFLVEAEKLLAHHDVLIAKVLIRNQPQINAQYGTDVGDRLIQDIQQMLLELDRSFLISQVSPSLYGVACQKWEDPQGLLDALKAGVDKINQSKVYPMLVTLSTGVTVAKHDSPEPMQHWVDQANLAMISSGRDGHGVVFGEETEQRSKVRELLGRLSVHSGPPEGMRWVFQPIVSTETTQSLGFETLCRWTDPILGDLAPDLFIQLAEDMDVLCWLDKWALMSVQDHLDELMKRGAKFITLNLSAKTLVDDESFVKLISETLSARQEFECSLVLELTESSIAHQPEKVMAQLEALRALGLKVAIDDFGTGETSLASIGGLPCDYLKLDSSLVHMGSEKMSEGLLEIGVKLAELLGAEVIVEGVETEHDLALARKVGAHYVQGWYTGRPFEISLD